MMRSFFSFVSNGFVAALLLSGCMADPFQQYQNEQAARQASATMHPIEVVSDPPGARIEVNNEYVADAPCTINVLGDSRGEVMTGVFIRAVPSTPGEYVQEKYIGAQIPHKILFVMNLGPATPEVNVNLGNQ